MDDFAPNEINEVSSTIAFSQTTTNAPLKARNMEDNNWVLYLNGNLLSLHDAYQHILSVRFSIHSRVIHAPFTLQAETKLNSKSTASIFLLALRHVLDTRDTVAMSELLEKSQQSSAEFSRKLAFRVGGVGSGSTNLGL